MHDYEQILTRIQADERYQRNLDWGRRRKGHPEGTLRKHIKELEGNLNSLRSKFSELDFWKLKVLIHVHDILKPDAEKGVPIVDPRSHASMAREFLSEFCDDADLLNMVQFHDEPYGLWKKYQKSGIDEVRLARLLETIHDWDLFLAFLIIDGCTEGKSRDPLIWFFDVIGGKIKSTFSHHDLM